MGTNVGFQRKFWIFQQEDSGFGSGQEPSGYIKLEIRNEKVKISASVQNLKEDESKFSYKLYIIKQNEKQVIPVCLGSLRLQRNKAEFQTELDGSNISGWGDSIQDYNAAAVIVEYKDNRNTQIVCPLAAYRDKKVSWRDELTHAIYNKSVSGGDNSEKLDLSSIYSHNDIQSKYEPDKTVESTFRPDKSDETENAVPVLDSNPTSEAVNAGGNILFSTGDEEKNGSETSFQPSNQEELENSLDDSDNGGQKASEIRSETNEDTANYGEQTINENEGCNIDKLKESLGRYFKEYDPFGSRRRDYKWWKVSSPVYLNNILYQCNARTPLLFNPKVMMAHFKYRHLIIGVYSDRLRRRECIVCGVPGGLQYR
ncbi:MAG TPA: hypothetical protein VHT34_04405 [Clostridia bacterium]|nr:hypothetical protein [Clostridia bacterium]